MSPSLRRFAAAALVAVTGFAAAACTSADDSGPPQNDHPQVVASTDVWGSVASAVGGAHAEVTALFNTPGADPHEFEPSMADTAKIQDADVLVFNGGHYDAYVETAAADSTALTVNATAIALGDDAAADHAGHNHSDHNHSDDHSHDDGANEHVFYDLAAVAQVADRVAAALSQVAPAHADYYRANADQFTSGIADLRARLAAIKAAHNGTKVGSTEPLSAFLLTEAGLVDVAPAAFAAAVENGQSPSAADVATFTDLLTNQVIKALIYNTQAVDPATLTVLQIARRSSVPVVELTESLPEGVTSYLDWQSGQIGQLEQALNS
ncbi:MAG: zinc ABC transporter substrate-binding protein [Gordonia sp. (in: high G+C Gram-positive bacteria)]|uniref:metal ABC transporter solute-binding protein, Zn/Mn family n=1 Tax=Gordonia sp. (in: high G+C Gram-positive bacteria) TaxID=84139 RepID=UPI003BB6E3C9